MKNSKKKEILEAYDMFDDNDISTERLLAMVSDYCKCEVDEVVEALVEKYGD